MSDLQLEIEGLPRLPDGGGPSERNQKRALDVAENQISSLATHQVICQDKYLRVQFRGLSDALL